MSDTDCDEWRNDMNDAQRDAAAAGVVGHEASVRMRIAITDYCAALDEIATEDSGPAWISDVIDVVTITDDFSPLP